MDYFKFDLQLFAAPEFPEVGTYVIDGEEGKVADTGVDSEPPSYNQGYYYLVIDGNTEDGFTATVNKATSTTAIEPANLEIAAAALAISTALTEGTWTFSGLGATKAAISSVPTGVSFAELTNGSTVAAGAIAANGAITVNGVAFTGIKSPAAGDVTFTVDVEVVAEQNVEKISATLGAENAAVTAPSGIDVTVGETTYTTKSAGTTIARTATANLGELKAGSVDLGQNEAIATTLGIITNTAEDAIKVASTGEVETTAGKNVEYNVVLAAGQEIVTDDGYTYKGAASALVAVTRTAQATSLTYALTGGTVTVDKGKKTLAGGNIIENTATAEGTNAITVDFNGNVTAMGTNGIAKVTIPASGSVQIDGDGEDSDGTVYTNADEETDPEKQTVAVIQAVYDADGAKAELLEGTVSVTAANVEITLGDAKITNSGAGELIVDDTNGVTKAAAGCSIDLGTAGGTSVMIDGKEYTNAAGETPTQATITVATVETKLQATLAAGSVVLGEGAAVLTGSEDTGTITNNSKTTTITVAQDGTITEGASADYTVEIKAEKTVTLGGTEYTTPSGKTAEIQVVKTTTSETPAYVTTLVKGTVVVAPEASVKTAIGTVTNNDTTEGHTIKVTAAGVVDAGENSADYTIALNDDAKVTIGEKEYSGKANAVVHVTKETSEAPVITLTGGSIDLGNGAGIITDIGTITNGAEDAVTVAKAGDISAKQDKAASYTIALGDEKAVTINGKTYTNKADAVVTVTKAADSTTLVESLIAGTVTVAASAAVETSIGTFTNNGTKEIVVGYAGAVTNVPTDAEAYTFALGEGKSITINSHTYTGAENAVVSVTKAAESNEVVEALTAGTVSVAKNGVIKTSNATFTNNGETAIVVDSSSVAENVKANAESYTIGLAVDEETPKAVVIGGATYTQSGEDETTIAVTKEAGSETLAKALSEGNVDLGEGADITASGTTFTNGAAATITVSSTGVVSGLTQGVFTAEGTGASLTYFVSAGTPTTDETPKATLDIYVVGDRIGAYNDVVAEKANIAFAAGVGTVKIEDEAVTAQAVDLTYSSGKNFYALVVANGQLTTVPYATAKEARNASGAIGYFKFDTSTAGTAKLTFHTTDTVEKAAKFIGAVNVDATALTEDASGNPLKTIVVSNVTADGNHVSLTHVAATVDAVTDAETYNYEEKNVLVAETSITLENTAGTAYYALNKVADDHGRTTYNLGSKTTGDAPDANYIKVVTKVKGEGEPAAEKNEVEISYVQKSGEGAVALDPETVLGIVASGAAADAEITVSDGIRNTITGAKGGVSAAVSGTNTKATLSYTTTFAWAAGTYFLEAGAGTVLTTDGAAAVNTDPTKAYNKVEVTVTEGVYKVKVSGVTGDLMKDDATPDINSIIVRTEDSVEKLDASDDTVDGIPVTIAATAGVTFDGTKYYTAVDAAATLGEVTVGKTTTVELTDGAVKMEKGLAITASDNVITNAATEDATNTITVDEDGAVTAIETNGIAQIVIPEEGTTSVLTTAYANEGESAATLTATATATNLTSGTVSTGANGAKIGWISGEGETAKVAIVTNTGTNKKVTVDATSGVTAIEEDGGASVSLANVKDTAIKVDGKEYKNAAAATATITLDSELAATLSAGTVTMGEGAAITANGHEVTNTGSTLTIASTGVISALAGGEAFKVGTGKTYTVGAVSGGKADIVVTGDRIGVYNDVTLDGATVTLASEVDTVTAKKTTETPEAISAEEVSLAYTAGKSYYALVNTSGALTTTACDSAEAAQKVTNAIGYFKFTAAGSGQTVTFHDVDGKYVSEVWQEGTQKQAIGVVNIDALNMTEGATGTPLTTIAVGDVSVNGVKLTNVVDTVTTVTGTDDENWTYKTIALLADDESISLDQTAGTKYYALSVASDTGKGKKTYSVADSPVTNPSDDDLKNNNYIVVTTSEDKKTIGVSYHTATAEGKGVTLDKTSVLDVVANGAANDATITFTDGITHEVTSGSNGAKVVDSAGLTTISYTTEFAWADGTYFASINTEDITVGLNCTTDPTDEDGYNKLVVTSTGEGDDKVYSVKVTGVKGDTMTTAVEPSVDSIAVTGAIKANMGDTSVLGATVNAAAGVSVTFDGTNYYVAQTGGAKLRKYDSSSLVEILDGSVQVPKSTQFEVQGWNNTTYKNETVSGEPAAAAAGIFTVGSGALSFAKGGAVTVVDGDYAGTKVENTSASAGTVTMFNGAVTDVSNTGACAVTIAQGAGKAAGVLGVDYTNTNASKTASLTVSGSTVKLASGVVTLNGDGVEKSLSVGDDYTITHTTTDLKTVTVSSTGEVTAIRKGATVSVGTTKATAEHPVTITIGDNEYTVKASATFTATALDHVALTLGSVGLDEGASIIANGTLFTNSADKTVTVAYTGEITGLDAGSAFAVAEDATGAAAANCAVAAGTGTGKLDIVVSGEKVGVYDEVDKATMTVVFVNGLSVVAEGGNPKAASAVELEHDGTHSVYALVNTDGALTAVGVADAAAAVATTGAIGYFKFTADGTKENVAFYNTSGKQATAIGDVTIDAEKLEGITAIDVTGVTVGTMKLNNLAAGATVTGAEEANCTWLTSYVLDDNQTITVGAAAATTYWTVNAGEADAKGIRTCTLTNAGSTAPAATVNYFKVVTTADGATEISYTQATEGTTKAEFSDASTLLVDATGAANGAAITVDDSVATKNVVSADENGATVSGGTTTISYTTTFAWAAGTYFTGSDDKTLAVGDTVTTDPANTAGYNKVVVTVADGVYKAVISGAKGDTMSTAVTPTIMRINLSDAVTKFDGTDESVVGKTIKAGVTGTTITLGEDDGTTRVISTGAVTIQRGETKKTFTPTVADTGVLQVKDDKAVAGSFALSAAASATETLEGSKNTHEKDDIASITIGGGDAASNASVTFTGGAINSITGLGAGETFTVTRYEDTDNDAGTDPVAVEYTFTYDSTGKFIKRVSSTGETVYFMTEDAESVDLVAVAGDFVAPVKADAAFNWKPSASDGTAGTDYYFSIEEGMRTIASGEGEAVEAGKVYIKAHVNYDGAIDELTTVVGTAAGTVATDTEAASRTVNIDASGVASVTYDKDGAAFKVALTNVGKNSVLEGLVEGDTVATATLKKNEKVTVNGADYVAATGGALAFKDAGLAGGTVTMASGAFDEIGNFEEFEYAIADGATATLAHGLEEKVISAVVTVETDEDTKATTVKSVTGLAEGDSISFIKDTDNGTVYEVQADNVVWKSVEVSGTTTVYVKKMANAGDDVVAEDAEGDNKYVAGTNNNQTFNWAAGTANFLVADVYDYETGEVTGTQVKIVPDTTVISYEHAGDKFVKLAVAESGALTMTEGTVTWKGEVTEASAISGAAYDVVMNCDGHAVKLAERPATSGAFAITGVATGSEFFAMNAKDTLTTGALSAGNTVKIGDVTYKASGSTQLGFLGGAMTKGAVVLDQTTREVSVANGATVAIDEGAGKEVALSVATVEDVTSVTSITGLGKNEVVTITEADGTTIKYEWKDETHVTRTVTKEGAEPVVRSLVLTAEGDNLLQAREIASAAFTWPDEKESTTFYRAFTGVSPSTAAIAANGSAVDLNVEVGSFVVEATVSMAAGADNVVMKLTPKKYNGTEMVAVTDEEAEDLKINVTGPGTYAKLVYDNSDGANNVKVAFTAVDAGSTFTGLVEGSTVQTVNNLAKGATVAVNGVTYTAIEAAGNQIEVYATEGSANIVKGSVLVTGEVTSSTDAGADVETLTVAGDGADGVSVVYTSGKPTSIKGLDAGETVTYVEADGDTTVYSYNEEGACTRVATSASAGTRETATIALTDDNLLNPKKETVTGMEVYSGLAWPETGKTAAAYAVYGESVAIGTDGEWLPVKDGEAEATTFVKANVAADGTLTLTKVKAANKKSEPASAGEFAGTETVTVDVNGGKVTLNSGGKGNLKGVTLNNIGAGSNVLSTGWTENDKVTTAALAVTETKDPETGEVTGYTRESVTVGGTKFTVGADKTTLAIKGYKEGGNTYVVVESGTLWLDKDYPNNYFKAQSGSGAMSDITYNKYDGDSAGVAVTVEGGKVTSIKGLDVKREGYDTGEGGTVKISTGGSDYVQYQAKRIAEYDSAKGEWVYKNVIERTDSIGNKATTALTDTSVNVVTIPEEKWTYSEIGTLQDFNWNGTGYFKAVDVYGDMLTAVDVATQDGSTHINGTSNEGEIYLKVVATKDSSSGAVTISEMSYVQVQENGELKTTSAVVGTINLDATGLKGVTLPTHAEKVVITGVTGGVFTGLNDTDLITGSKKGTIGIEKTVGKKTVTTEFVVAEDSAFSITGAETITSGVFTVADEAAGSAVLDATVNTTAAREIKVTGGDGVKVTFLGGEITSVQDMEDGETATITSYQYTAKGDKAYETTIITKSGSTVTKTIKDSAYPVDIVMTSTTATADTDVFGLKTFKMATAFDFSNSKTTAALGLFEITGVDEYGWGGKTTVGPQKESEVPAAFGDTDKYYVMVGAGKKSGTYTVNYAQVFHYDKDEAALLPVESYALSGGLTITAPTDGNLTIASDAFKLKDGETERDYAINVAGAQAGKTYIGLGERDTVTASLTANQFITVGATAKTTKKLTAAADGEVVVNGEGKAYTGTFMVTTAGFEAYNWATTTKLTGNSSKAVAVVAKGAVTSLKNLEVGKSVTITKTTAAGAVSSETYKAEKGSGDALKITRTTVAADGFTEVKIGYAPTGTELIDDSIYTETAKTEINSTFNWAAGGYFAVTTDANGAFSSAAVKPGTTKITTKEAGNLYLKADNSTGNWVFTLQEAAVDETTGLLEMEDVAWTVKTKGTLSVEAPAEKALTFDRVKSTIPDGVALTITGVSAEHDEDGNFVWPGSTITNLQDGDVVSSANLVKGDYVDINGKGYSIAAADALKVTISDYQPILSDGTISVSYATVKTTAGSFMVSGDADVKVLDGKVMGISGLTGVETVAFTDANNNVATYNADGITFTNFAAGSYITTMAMAEGANVNGANYTAGGGVLKFYNAGTTFVPDAQLVDGTVKLDDQGDAVTLKGGTAVTLTTGAANPDVKVTVANGVVTSITGLQAGEVITTGTTTYAVDANAPTLVTKTVGGVTVTGFLSKNGGDVLSARYLEANPDIDISDPANALEGQLSWGDVSGRSTGYFELTVKETKTSVTKTAKAIAEQTTKTTVGDKLKAGQSQIYVVANTVTDEWTGEQTLHIGAIQATNDGTKTVISSADAAKLLDGASLSVTAPATAITVNGQSVVPALTYRKTAADKYHIAINKVAANSIIRGLTDKDTATTNTLDIGNVVMMGGNVYMAGAKGTMEFLGEGDASANTARTTMKTGTLKLIDGANVLLSGSKDGAVADIVVNFDANGGGEQPVVKVANGVVTSITGLKTQGATVTLTQEGIATTTYEVMYTEETAWDTAGNATAWTTMVERKEVTSAGTKKTYASFATTKNVYGTSSYNKKGDYSVTNGYKDLAADTEVGTDKLYTVHSDTKGKAAAYTVYVAAWENWTVGAHKKEAWTAVTLAQTSEGTAVLNKIEAKNAARGGYYIAATVKTDGDVTTIQKLEVAQVDATGKPAVLKGWTVTNANIDGALIAGGAAKLSYAIPKATTVTVTNAAVGSVFTAVKAADQIDSAATGEDGYTFAKAGSVTVYNIGDVGQETRTVTYKTGTGNTSLVKIVTDDDGKITGLTGLDAKNESVTIVEKTAGDEVGAITTVYAVSKDALTLTKTVTAADGAVTVTVANTQGSAYDWIADAEKLLDEDAVAQRKVVSDFDWTLQKNTVGYFAITTNKSGTSAAVKTGKATLNPYTKKGSSEVSNTASYLAVAISDDGVLDSISQVRFDRKDSTAATYNTLQAYGAGEGETKFSGTINVAAPTGVRLVFDRDNVGADGTIDLTEGKTSVAITGAIKDSNIENLVVGDKVTTASLKAPKWNTTWRAWEYEDVTVNGTNFEAGAAGALSFLAQKVNDEVHATVTGGTILIRMGASRYVGKTEITAVNGDGVTVKATTDKKGNTTYTVGDLEEGETFTVNDFSGTVRTYRKTVSALFCEATTGSETVTTVYNKTAGTSVTSAILDKATTPDGKNWTTCGSDTLSFQATTEEGLKLVSGKAVTVDLATLDKRIATDETAAVKAGWGTGTLAGRVYDFVIDKYMANPAKFAGASSVINNANYQENLQQIVGDINAIAAWNYNATTKKYTTLTYNATANVAQTIKAADTWTVNGSGQADIITGASKGSDTLNGGAGNDTLTGGGANDTFEVNAGEGKDVVKSYVTGKDRIEYANFDFDDIELVAGQSGKNTADVLLHDGSYVENTGAYNNGVLLAAMGNGKAVTIGTGVGNNDDKTYFFGNAASTKGMTFSYVEGAYYLGKAGTTTANTLSVKTDSKKAAAKALGDNVEIDLTDETHYKNINAIDGSKSANAMILTAAASGSTLKGGTYQTTLKGGAGADSMAGGSGADVFWFDTVEKADVVTGYASGKDSVWVGGSAGATATEINGLTIQTGGAAGTDVIIGNGETGSVTLQKAANATKAITFRADEDGNTLTYYVGSGKAKAKNNFTATYGTDAVKDEESVDKTVDLKSYYVGSNVATDTLAIKTAKGDKTAVAAKFSLADMANHLSSIDVLDTSGINIAGSSVTLQGAASGTFTLKGTAGTKNVTDRFNLTNLEAGAANQITLTNLDVNEVIELAAGMKLEGAGNTWSITDEAGTSYGTITLTGATKNAAFTKGSTASGNVTYTRSVK